MNKLTNFIRTIARKPKTAVLVTAALLTLGVVVPMAVRADWGPGRPVFDYNKPCNPSDGDPYDRCGSLTGPVFNSFINTPSYGDERNFTRVRPAGQGAWQEDVNVTPGQEVEVRVYVHNNANQSTNGPDFTGPGVATNTRVRLFLPEGVANGFDVAGYVSADNSAPARVYDTATVRNGQKAFDITYVPGSARIYNNGVFKNGAVLSDEVVGANGAQIGWTQLNGKVPGCFEFEAVVIIKVKITAPELDIEKKVNIASSGPQWQEEVTANVGDKVSWLIDYKNSGSAVMEDITIRDEIPRGLTLVPGSITWFDVNHQSGETLQDTSLSSGGVNVGNYGPQGGGYIRFQTVVNDDLPENCEMTNTVKVRAKNVPEVSNTAKVKIRVESCKPTQPVFSCDLLTVSKVSGRTFRFTTDFTAQGGATLESFTYDFGDGTEDLMTDRATVEHTYAADGTFVARVTVNVSVNGQDRSVTSDSCAKPITTTSTSPPTTPTELPNTGAGDVMGIFTLTTMLGAVIHRVVSRRILG